MDTSIQLLPIRALLEVNAVTTIVNEVHEPTIQDKSQHTGVVLIF